MILDRYPYANVILISLSVNTQSIYIGDNAYIMVHWFPFQQQLSTIEHDPSGRVLHDEIHGSGWSSLMNIGTN